MSEKKEETNVDREKNLEENINKFFKEVMKCPDDRNYYSELDTEKLFEMKKAFGGINNIVTYKCTLAAVNKLGELFKFKGDELKKIKYDINGINSNTNGYDIKIEDVRGINIIAEVKCNNTLTEKTKFYNKQQEEIIKDIRNLCEGKKKAKFEHKITDYYKFMVLLDTDEGKVRKAVNAFLHEPIKKVKDVPEIKGKSIRDFIKNKENVSLIDDTNNVEYEKLNKNTIYILCVNLGKK